MKVLLIAHQFLPDCIAGTEVLVSDVARELQSRGHEVKVFAGIEGAPGEVISRYDFQGYEVQRVNINLAQTSLEDRLSAARNPHVEYEFRKVIDDWKPDITHFFHFHRLTVRLISIAAAASPVFFTATDFWSICPFGTLRLPDGTPCDGPSLGSTNCVRHHAMLLRPKWAKLCASWTPDFLIAAALRYARHFPIRSVRAALALQRRHSTIGSAFGDVRRFFFASDAIGAMLSGIGVDQSRLTMQPYGIDVDAYDDVPPIGNSEHLRVGFIGQLVQHKGVDVLLRAMRQVASPNLRLKIYGNLDGAGEFGRQLLELRGDDPRTSFEGSFPPSKIRSVLAGLDCLVVPSTWQENMPLVACSALAARRPIIASDVSGLRSIVRPSRSGFLFPPGDAAALSRIMENLSNDRESLGQLPMDIKDLRTLPDYVDELLLHYQTESSLCA